MGDRANVYVRGHGDQPGVYLYTHGWGTELPQVVQTALAKQMRWDDGPYLTRIIFCEMLRDAYSEEKGYGISTSVCDGGDRIIVVDPDRQTIHRNNEHGAPVPFEVFIELANPSWDFMLESYAADPNDPMTDDQRAALFALFHEVFQTTEDDKRHGFTAEVLGPDAPASWSRDGGLTVYQAERLIGTLRFLTEA